MKEEDFWAKVDNTTRFVVSDYSDFRYVEDDPDTEYILAEVIGMYERVKSEDQELSS